MTRLFRMLPKAALTLALTAGTALGGCNQQDAPSEKAASGAKLLPRSVSDDMLPYDTVRSQSPLAAPTYSGSGSVSPRSSATEAALPEDDTANAAAAAAAEVEAAAAEPAPQQ